MILNSLFGNPWLLQSQQLVDGAAISINYRKAHVSRLGDLGLKAFYNGDIEFNKLVHKVFSRFMKNTEFL